jgi:3-phenylpropionate/trans-cinnamate dioxygenase ferredoxin component
MAWHQVLRMEDLAVGETRAVEADLEEILVCRVASDAIYAVSDRCTHDDGPLGEGVLEGRVVTCPRHGAQFDVATGAVLKMPAPVGLQTYPVRVVDGWLEVEIP